MTSDQQVPHLALTHGQVLWVLARGGSPSPKLQDMIKYLRRLGVPFGREELGRGRGVRVIYGYEHLVELEMARLYRAQGMDLGDVARALVWLRDQLRPLYRRAYAEASTGLGAPVKVNVDRSKGLPLQEADGSLREQAAGSRWLQGCYLVLGLTFRDDGTLMHDRVRLLGPWQAVHELSTMGRDYTSRSFIALSQVVVELVRFANVAPEIKPGPT